ncbi:hypothetical protein Ciccas_004520 [Cichlidogyrus casuarinus]|uniref:C2H2-type domain-containing protein n=1 Tax=Cichlidogyrus casuarinus TaxID=1844966 RepID=A0ABD2QBR9_9PLAT
MHGEKQASVNCIYQGSTESTGSNGLDCMFCEHSSVTSSDLVHHYSNFHNIKNVSPNFLKSKGSPIKKIKASPEFKQDMNGSIQTSMTDTSLNGSRDIADSETTEGHWKCKNCGKEYDKKKYFVEHSIACGKAPKLVCLCGRTCKWRSNFYAHRKRCPVYNSQLPKQADLGNKRNSIPSSSAISQTIATSVSSGMVFSPSGQLIGIRTGGPLTTQATPATLFPIGSTSLLPTQIDPSQLQATVLKAEAAADGSGVQTAQIYYTQITTPGLTEVATSAAPM